MNKRSKVILGTTLSVTALAAVIPVVVSSCGNSSTNKEKVENKQNKQNKQEKGSNQKTINVGTLTNKQVSQKKIDLKNTVKPVWMFQGKKYTTESEAKEAKLKVLAGEIKKEKGSMTPVKVYSFNGHEYRNKSDLIKAVKQNLFVKDLTFNNVKSDILKAHKTEFKNVKGNIITNPETVVLVDNKVFHTAEAAVEEYLKLGTRGGGRSVNGDGSGNTYGNRFYDANTKQFGRNHAVAGLNKKAISGTGAEDGQTYIPKSLFIKHSSAHDATLGEFWGTYEGLKDVKYNQASTTEKIKDHSNDLAKYKQEFLRVLGQFNYWQEHRKQHDLVYALWIPNQKAVKMPSGRTWGGDNWYLWHASTGNGTTLREEVENAKNVGQLNQMWKYIKDWQWRFRQWSTAGHSWAFWESHKQEDITMTFSELSTYKGYGMDFRNAFKMYNSLEQFNFERKFEYKGKWYATRQEAQIALNKAISKNNTHETQIDINEIKDINKGSVEGIKSQIVGAIDDLHQTLERHPRANGNEGLFIDVSTVVKGTNLEQWFSKLTIVGDTGLRIPLKSIKEYAKNSNDTSELRSIFNAIKQNYFTTKTTSGMITFKSEIEKFSFQYKNVGFKSKIEALNYMLSIKNVVSISSSSLGISNMNLLEASKEWIKKHSNKSTPWTVNGKDFKSEADALQEQQKIFHSIEPIKAKIKQLEFEILNIQNMKKLPLLEQELKRQEAKLASIQGKISGKLYESHSLRPAPANAVLGLNKLRIKGVGDESGNTYKEVLINLKDKSAAPKNAIAGKNYSKQELLDILKNNRSWTRKGAGAYPIEQFYVGKVNFTDGDAITPADWLKKYEIKTIIKGKVFTHSKLKNPEDKDITVLGNMSEDAAIVKAFGQLVDSKTLLTFKGFTGYKSTIESIIHREVIKKHPHLKIDKIYITPKTPDVFKTGKFEKLTITGNNHHASYKRLKHINRTRDSYFVKRVGESSYTKYSQSPKDLQNGDMIKVEFFSAGSLLVRETKVEGLKTDLVDFFKSKETSMINARNLIVENMKKEFMGMLPKLKKAFIPLGDVFKKYLSIDAANRRQSDRKALADQFRSKHDVLTAMLNRIAVDNDSMIDQFFDQLKKNNVDTSLFVIKDVKEEINDLVDIARVIVDHLFDFVSNSIDWNASWRKSSNIVGRGNTLDADIKRASGEDKKFLEALKKQQDKLFGNAEFEKDAAFKTVKQLMNEGGRHFTIYKEISNGKNTYHLVKDVNSRKISNVFRSHYKNQPVDPKALIDNFKILPGKMVDKGIKKALERAKARRKNGYKSVKEFTIKMDGGDKLQNKNVIEFINGGDSFKILDKHVAFKNAKVNGVITTSIPTGIKYGDRLEITLTVNPGYQVTKDGVKTLDIFSLYKDQGMNVTIQPASPYAEQNDLGSMLPMLVGMLKGTKSISTLLSGLGGIASGLLGLEGVANIPNLFNSLTGGLAQTAISLENNFEALLTYVIGDKGNVIMDIEKDKSGNFVLKSYKSPQITTVDSANRSRIIYRRDNIDELYKRLSPFMNVVYRVLETI